MATISLGATRGKFFRMAYIAAVATATVGWLWMILVGVGWLLGRSLW